MRLFASEHHAMFIEESNRRIEMAETVGGAVGGVMGLLIVACVGLVIGTIAKLLMPGPDPGGWFLTILLGIAGSWVGQFIFGALGLGSAGILGAIGGAMLLLLAYRMVRRA